MKDIINNRIAALEAELKKVETKISPNSRNLVKDAIEAEKIKYAITQLYICLGSSKN